MFSWLDSPGSSRSPRSSKSGFHVNASDFYIVTIVRLDLNSIQAIAIAPIVPHVFPCDRLNILWDDPDDQEDHIETMLNEETLKKSKLF